MIRKLFRLMLCILLSIVILAACATPTPAPTVTPMPSTTPEPTATNTSAPTETSIPTATPKPMATNTSTSTQTPIPTATSGVVQLSKRGYHDAVYDIKADRVIVFGGEDDYNGSHDIWIYDITSNTWVKMSPAECPCEGEGPMAYDSASDRTIFYAGNRVDQQGNLHILNRTWAYDYNTDTWTDLQSTGTPSGLLGARMVYDTKADRMILFGGLKVPLPTNFIPKNLIFPTDTWSYDFNKNTWTNMQPKTSPPGSNYIQMTYDAKSDRVLMFGAAGGMGVVWGDDNVWAYDYKANTWTTQKPAVSPITRDYGSMAYDPVLDRTFLFGGATADDVETPFDDLWSYDYASQTWEQIKLTSGPSARAWHTMTYSAKSDRIVLIGGGPDRSSFTNEVWIFNPNAKTWTQVGPQ